MRVFFTPLFHSLLFSVSVYFHWTSARFLHAFISFLTFLSLCNFSFSFLPFDVSFFVSLYLFRLYFLCSFVFFICVNVYVMYISFVSLFIFVFLTFLPFALFLCFSSFLSLRFVRFWTSILLLPVAVLLLTASIASLSVHQVQVS